MDDDQRVRRRRTRPEGSRIPGVSQLFEATDEMIAFVETYQKVWESESKAMLAMGEFLGARSESLRNQVELMKMGGDTFRRYARWSETLLGLRPEVFTQAWLDMLDRLRIGGRAPEGGAEAEAEE
ncbi:MAG: hypothetical protein WEC75_04685 [Dehalococcoidia bacterium]